MLRPYLTLLLVLLCLNGFSQKITNDIRGSWNDLTIDLQRKADLSEAMARMMAKSPRIDKAILAQLSQHSISLAQCLETLKFKDSSSVQLVKKLHDKLTESIMRAMVEVEKDAKLSQSMQFIELVKQLEGTENRIAISGNDYNKVCAEHHRTDLIFEGPKRPSVNVQF